MMKKSLAAFTAAMTALSVTAATASAASYGEAEKSTAKRALIYGDLERKGYHRTTEFAQTAFDMLNIPWYDNDKLEKAAVWTNGGSIRLEAVYPDCAAFSVKGIADMSSLADELGCGDKIDELAVVYDDEEDVTVVSLSFSGNDHELNYMIADKALSLLKRKWEPTVANSGFDHMEIFFFETYDGIPYDIGAFTGIEKELSELIEKTGIPVSYDSEKGMLGISELSGEERLALMCTIYGELGIKPSYGNVPLQAAYDAPVIEGSILDPNDVSYEFGDANCDDALTIADATAIMQAIGNPDKYRLSPQGSFNGDIYNTGDGLTGMDALNVMINLVRS